jgi:hypothetical protein
MKAKKDRHPSRSDMLKAIASGRIPFKNHLVTCAACSELFDFLQDVEYQRAIDSSSPSERLITRCARIPLIEATKNPRFVQQGRLISDSWRGMPALALRDAASGLERRMRLASDSVVLDLVAERRPSGWCFFARAYDGNNVASSNFVLQVGREKLTAGAREMYVWESVHPPRKINLLSSETRIEFDKIDWKAAE